MMAMQELVVPRSIPITLLIDKSSVQLTPAARSTADVPMGRVWQPCMGPGRRGQERTLEFCDRRFMHQGYAVVSSFDPDAGSSEVAAFATTTMAGFSRRPFKVQQGVHACMTVPGGCTSLSCSAIAWCRFGSNGRP